MNNYIKIFASIIVATLSLLVTINVNAQCNAVIGINNVIQQAGDTVSGCDPFNILFNDKTTGGTSTRVWNFGDGTPNLSVQNPTHEFSAGKKTDTIYTVTLTSTCLPSGSSSVTLKVKVLRRPNVDFSIAKTTVCQQTEVVSFNNLSENKVGYTNSWNFGGEGASNLKNPTFTFQNDGLKYIALTVTDDRGCFRLLTKTDYITVVKLPNPDFSLDQQVGCNPMKVTFGNTTSEANITNWLWDFGDGSSKVATKDLLTPHTYSTPNVISASLTAVNSLGCSNTTTKSIVNRFTPEAKFVLPSLVCKGATGVMTYNGLANVTTKYKWTFDNKISVLSGSKSGPYNLSFDIAGTSTVNLIVTDTLSGCTDTTENFVNIKAIPSLSLESSNGDTICKATPVTFTASPAGYSNYIFKLNKVEVQNSADNVYIAPLNLNNQDTISVEIENGCGGYVVKPIILTVNELPEVTLISSKDTIYRKTRVIFTAIPKKVGGYDKYEFFEGNVLMQSGPSNKWITDSLTDGKLVTVVAFENGCTGNVSNKVVKVIDPFDSPDITANTTLNSITLNWNKVLNELGKNPSGYQISINGGAFIDPSSGFGPNGTSHLITGLNPGDSIKVVIKTLATKLNNEDTLGNSVVSEEFTFFALKCNNVSFNVGPKQSICKGDSVTILVNGVSISNYKIQWLGSTINKLGSHTFLPKNSMNAQIRVLDSLQPNCVFVKYTYIEVKPLPTVTLTVSPQIELLKGDFLKYTAFPANYDLYTFENKGEQVQQSTLNIYSTKNYKNGDVVTVKAEFNGCKGPASNPIILKLYTSIDPAQIQLDTATTSSVIVDWSPVEGATGYLVSVNGQNYVLPNSGNIKNSLSHLISGLSPGQKVEVLVKAFNSTDTSVSTLFTTYALNCRTLVANLISSPVKCAGEEAYVSISNELPSYIDIKWQNGVAGKNKTYLLTPLVKTKVKVDFVDTERPGCDVTRYYDVDVDYTGICNNNVGVTTLGIADINLDSATISSVAIKWETVKDATGYLVSINGKSYVIPNGENTGKEVSHLIAGLTAGEKVDVVVKAFNAVDTTISSVFTTYALSCRPFDVTLAGTSSVCSTDSAVVQITNTLPSYAQIKWQGGTLGNQKVFKLKTSNSINVQVDVHDIDRAGCIITKNYLVTVDSSLCEEIVKTKIDQAQINLDTATISSVSVKWQTVKDATGYLISVNGKTFVVPNGTTTASEVNHLISGLTAGEKVDVVVKAFNSTDTSISTIFTTYALSCRPVNITLTSNTPLCVNDTATVSFNNSLESYFQFKWQGGGITTEKKYTFLPVLANTKVKLEIIDSERAGCEVIRYFDVEVNQNCTNTDNSTQLVIKDKMKIPDVSIDTSTTNSVTIGWVPIVGATGYSISVNGGTFTNYNGSLIPDENGNLTFTKSGLSPNETVSFVVKAFNGKDTVTSVIVNGIATNCSSLAYTLEATTPICFGDSATLNISSVLPSNYQIKWNNGAVGTSRNFKFKPLVTTQIPVTVTNPTEPLCGVTKFVLVKVNPIPVVTLSSSDADSTIYKGTPITFTANPSGLDGYEFYDRFSIVQNGALSVYNTSTLENNHKITVIGIKDGCRSAASAGITTTVKDLSVDFNFVGTSTDSTVTLTWNKIPDATKYLVSINGGEFTNVSSGTTINDTSHTVSSLDPEVGVTIVVKVLTTDPNKTYVSEPWLQTTILCNGITFKVSNDTTICQGSEVELKLLNTNVAKYSLRWNYNLPTKNTSYKFIPSKTLTIPVQLIDSSQINCPYYRNIKVTVNERSSLRLSATDTSYQICQGEVFTVSAYASNLDNYIFRKGNTILQNSPNPSFLVVNYAKGDTITVEASKKSCNALNNASYAKIVNPIPSSVIDANVTTNACQGQNVIYSGVPLKNIAKYSFFENGILAQSSGNSSFTKTNVQPGVLNPVSLTVKDLKTGCSSLLSAPKNITVLPYTEITSASNASANTICAGSSIKVTITPSNLTKYQFYVNDTLQQDSVINTFTKSRLKNGDKIKTVGVNTNSCSSPEIAPIVVVVKPVAQPNIVQDTIKVCEGTNANIKALIPSGLTPSILWENSGETNVDSISRLYAIDTKVKVKTTLNGCDARDSVLIKVYKLASSSSNLVSNAICDGNNAVFTILPNNLSKYKFFVNGVLKQDSVINTFTSRTLKNGDIVKSEVVNPAYCSNPSNSEVTVTVNPVIKPIISLDTIKVCSGVIAKVKATIPSGTPTLTWNTGETGKDSLVKTFTKDTLQILTATANGCSASDSVYILVDKVQPPVLVIDMKDGNKENNNWVLCRDEIATFSVTGSVLGKYEWYDPSWNQLSTTNEVSVSPNSTTTYSVVGYNMACKDTASVKLEIVSCGTTTQIITPGTDGKNDKWVALDSEEYFKNNTVTIFNRWGNEVYNVTNYKNDWEGTNQDGEKLPEGTYYYVIKIEGNSNTKVGFIMIKR